MNIEFTFIKILRLHFTTILFQLRFTQDEIRKLLIINNERNVYVLYQNTIYCIESYSFEL